MTTRDDFLRAAERADFRVEMAQSQIDAIPNGGRKDHLDFALEANMAIKHGAAEDATLLREAARMAEALSKIDRRWAYSGFTLRGDYNEAAEVASEFYRAGMTMQEIARAAMKEGA